MLVATAASGQRPPATTAEDAESEIVGVGGLRFTARCGEFSDKE